MDEQKLNEKLAKWGGIGIDEFIMYKKEYNFIQSLDACFKWLVPKLEKELPTADFYELLKKWLYHLVWSGGNPALALCLAIDKLIDGGK